MRWTWMALALLLSLPAARTAAQGDADQAIAAVREMTMQARFADAIGAARGLLDRDDLSASQRNVALEVLAVAQIADRQTDDAAQTLQLLYSRDPAHRLADPDASPPVISAFARARESQPPQVPVRLEHRPPALSRREPPSLEVRVAEGDDAVSEVRLVYRAGAEGAARVVMSRRADGAYTARIPVIGDAASATDVAYHIEALAPSLNALATLGTAAEPLQLRIPAEVASPAQAARSSSGAVDATPAGAPVEGGGDNVAEQWWFWTIIAVVLVGGAVTAGVVVGTSGQGPQPGTLGTARLMQLEL